MKTITIAEDVKIPGTNVILEKGDRVQILNEGILQIEFPFWVKADDYHEFDLIRTVLNRVSLKRLRIDYKEYDWDAMPPKDAREPVVGVGDYIAKFFLK